MALTQTSTNGIKDATIATADIAADAITGAKIADDAVDSEHYTDGSIDTAHIADDAVTADKLANAINTDIAAKAVLTGSTNNTITTVTGANAIQGEANLTFDGTHLNLGNTGSNWVGPLNVGTGTSGAAQVASIYSNSDTYGGLWFADGTSGADRYVGAVNYYHTDDSLRFDANGAERVRIDSGGRILKGVTSAEGSRNNTSTRYPHVQLSSPWSSGLGSTSITCTDDYPVVFLNSNASYANNSGAGVIAWSIKDGAGNYCNTASIESKIDGTPGNNDSPGELIFNTTADGTCDPTERLRIDSIGAVTTPNQPCSFYVGLSNTATTYHLDNTETLVFATVKRNEGGHYNGSNGRFTAPVAGTYFVGVNVLIDHTAALASRYCDLQKNGSGYATICYHRSGGESRYEGMSGTALIELAVGDYISIRGAAGIHTGVETAFIVYLLG